MRDCSPPTPRSRGRATASATAGGSAARSRSAAAPAVPAWPSPPETRLRQTPCSVERVLRGAATQAVGHGISRIPGLKRLPVMKVIAIGEIALLARSHAVKLTAEERRRLVALVGRGRGRPSKLSADEREELSKLVAKAEPRLFAGLVADKLSPVPLPRRLVRGRRRPG